MHTQFDDMKDIINMSKVQSQYLTSQAVNEKLEAILKSKYAVSFKFDNETNKYKCMFINEQSGEKSCFDNDTINSCIDSLYKLTAL